jgi:RimJ/RimL family protein N-acetyltransferase
MSWLPHPIVLSGKLVRLEPLTEAHFPALIECGAAREIWSQLPIDGSQPERLRRELGNALLQRMAGTQYPFTVFAQEENRIIGSTRFFDLFPEHRKLEIGWTWYAPDSWGKGYNTECKLLLLEHAFEKLSLNRVQFKTRDTNLRSRAAIEKIGACYEGCLRHDRILPDGSLRDTMVYSILQEEWPKVKKHLSSLLNAREEAQALKSGG